MHTTEVGKEEEGGGFIPSLQGDVLGPREGIIGVMRANNPESECGCGPHTFPKVIHGLCTRADMTQVVFELNGMPVGQKASMLC